MVLIKRNVYECFFQKKKKEKSALQIVHDTNSDTWCNCIWRWLA